MILRALWTEWHFEPGPAVALAAFAAMYAIGVRAVWRHAGTGRGVSRRRMYAFTLGLGALAFALVSPLDGLSESLFSAHMLQHLVLITIAPTLLVLGAPHIAIVWAIPARARRALARRWLRARALRNAWQVLSAAPVAVALHASALWTWHLPGPYEAALSRPVVHAFEHISFLGTALLFWWAVIEPRGQRRMGYALGILYVFATAMQSGALGAILTLARSPWYTTQGAGAHIWGLTPLEDQQLAGLIMWVPGGLLYVAAASCLFVAWLSGGRLPDRQRVSDTVGAVAA